jgi:ribosomal protein S27AE
MRKEKKYNSRNLTWKKPKSDYKMDPKSDRYRVCPNCGIEFMTDHLSRIFCGDGCADEFHNRKKRDAQLNGMEAETNPPVSAIHSTNNPGSDLVNNMKILDALPIDKEEGNVFHVEQLDQLGLNLNYFSGRGELYNINPELGCHFLQVGYYRLYRLSFSEFLIIKQENLQS